MEEIKFAFIISDENEHPHPEEIMFSNKDIKDKIIGVKDVEQAIIVANELVAEGYNRIGLCNAFEGEGYQKVKEAVGHKAKVGCIMYNL